MSLEGLVIILVILLCIAGYWGNGRWYNSASPAGPIGPGYIIGLLFTILIAVIIVVLIFMVLGGSLGASLHLTR
jgi:hypothetical protein